MKEKRIASLKKVEHTKDWVDKIREANKEQKPTDYCKERSSETHKNTHWYNNGTVEKMYFDDEVPSGFTKGRLKNPFPNQSGIKKTKETVEKISYKKKGSSWYNNGEKEIMVYENNIPIGFVKGRLKNQ